MKTTSARPSMLALFGMAALSVSACFLDTDCLTTVLSEELSPDQEHVARVVFWNCGAVGPAMSMVLLQEPDELADDWDPSNILLSTKGDLVSVSLRWVSDEELVIECPAYAVPWQERTEWNGILVRAVATTNEEAERSK